MLAPCVANASRNLWNCVTEIRKKLLQRAMHLTVHIDGTPPTWPVARSKSNRFGSASIAGLADSTVFLQRLAHECSTITTRLTVSGMALFVT